MTGQSPISAERFFIAGGTLRRDARCYIPRAADRQLYDALKKNEICYVLTSRQMGKSSLMVRTAARLREEGVSVAILDLTGLGQNLTPHQWYNGLLERIGQQLDLEDEVEQYWLGCGHLGPMLTWMDAISQVVLPRCPKQLVIFVDEIDAVRSLPFCADEFFAGIRELYNRRTQQPELYRLTFCLLGVASPSDLISDVRTTPFNIGRRIELGDFTPAEASPLAEGLAPELSAGQRALQRVLHWTNGHPYLTQRLCLAVADQDSASQSTVDKCCEDLFLSQKARQQDDNLLFVRERLLRSEVDTPSLLTLYSKICNRDRVRDDETNPLMTVLRLSGIVRNESGQLKVRNRVYAHVFDEEWVTSNLPGAEIRRQRIAFLRGLKLAGAIAIPVLLAVATYAFLNIYRVRTSVPLLSFKPPDPPAFWASFTRPSPQMAVGSLAVSTSEDGATVLINNREYGRTGTNGQLRVPVMQPGSYLVQVEKPGYQGVSQQASILENKETQLFFKLQKQVFLGATLAIQQGLAGTRITVDGTELGTIRPDGTFSAEIRPGEHSVAFSKDGFLSKQLKQDFAAGKKIMLDGQLRPDVELQDWNSIAQSNDSAALENYVRRYPNGRFSDQARSRADELEWRAAKNSNDLVALDNYLKKFPNGQNAAAAKASIAQLQKEASDWSTARNAHDPNALQAFLRNYPNGQYSQQARDQLRRLLDGASQSESHGSDRQQILTVLQRFGQAFEHKDVDELSAVWPSLSKQELKKIKDSFRDASSIRMQLQPSREVQIDGNRATVTCLRSLQFTFPGGVEKGGNSNVTIQLEKRTANWVIQSVE